MPTCTGDPRAPRVRRQDRRPASTGRRSPFRQGDSRARHGHSAAMTPAAASEPCRIAGDPATGLLLIADHAANHVPADVDLGIDPALLDQHVAIDIGVAPLGKALCGALGCPGLLAGISRLVVDLNREADDRSAIPVLTDGRPIPGNAALDTAGRAARIARYWTPWHAAISAAIAADRPRLLISLHSFTPRLASQPDVLRPWQVGILYNHDERAARLALAALRAAGVSAGDNEPYSGRVLNATMDRHGEANGIAYLGIEVRQDLIGDEPGVAKWGNILAAIIRTVMLNLFQHPFRG